MAIFQPKRRNSETREMEASNVFWCDFTYKGRRIRESTGQTKITLARKYEDRRKRELENAVAGVTATKSEDRIMTVKAAIGEWSTVQTAGKKPKSKAYTNERCAHLIEHLGARLVCDITAGVVAEYIGIREAKGAVAASINREVFMLSRVLRVDRNTAWLELGRSKKEREPIGKALTEEEEESLLKAARANRSKYALPVIAAALYTGFRAGEVRTLRWRQLDFLSGWIRSEQSKTKAGSYREVPLLPKLKQILVDHRAFVAKKLKAPPEPDHFIFPFSSRGMPVDPERPCTNIASAWYQIREAAGVTCRLHDCRHTYATRLIEAGVSEAIVRELVGHVDQGVIQRYTHIRRDTKKAAIERAFLKVSNGHDNISPNIAPLEVETPKQAAEAKSLVS